MTATTTPGTGARRLRATARHARIRQRPHQRGPARDRHGADDPRTHQRADPAGLPRTGRGRAEVGARSDIAAVDPVRRPRDLLGRRRRARVADPATGPRPRPPTGSVVPPSTPWPAIPKPTVAAVTGYALGAGLSLALAADWRVCGDNAKLGATEILAGLVPGGGGCRRLARAVGAAGPRSWPSAAASSAPRRPWSWAWPTSWWPPTTSTTRRAGLGGPLRRRARRRRWPGAKALIDDGATGGLDAEPRCGATARFLPPQPER